jgi:hypothetical protein
LNQNVTAPLDLPQGQIGGFLSDATALWELREHPQTARNDTTLSEMGTLGRAANAAAGRHLSALSKLAFVALSDFRRCNAFYTPTVATFDDLSSAISVSRVVTAAGQLHAETTCEVSELSLPLTQDLPKTTLERFTRALGGWKGLLAPDHFDSIMRHIERMLSDEEELEEDQVVPSPSSFDDMLAFFTGRPWDRASAVGLNRRGQFSVSWGKSHPNVDITLTFLGEGVVKWYVYGLGKRHRGSAVGTSDRADLPAVLSRLGCDEWMAR